MLGQTVANTTKVLKIHHYEDEKIEKYRTHAVAEKRLRTAHRLHY